MNEYPNAEFSAWQGKKVFDGKQYWFFWVQDGKAYVKSSDDDLHWSEPIPVPSYEEHLVAKWQPILSDVKNTVEMMQQDLKDGDFQSFSECLKELRRLIK